MSFIDTHTIKVIFPYGAMIPLGSTDIEKFLAHTPLDSFDIGMFINHKKLDRHLSPENVD